jgi:hypothetical protein
MRQVWTYGLICMISVTTKSVLPEAQLEKLSMGYVLSKSGARRWLSQLEVDEKVELLPNNVEVVNNTTTTTTQGCSVCKNKLIFETQATTRRRQHCAPSNTPNFADHPYPILAHPEKLCKLSHHHQQRPPQTAAHAQSQLVGGPHVVSSCKNCFLPTPPKPPQAQRVRGPSC